MNWQPFLSKLNKIKVLAETANQDGHLSKLEKDLIASYVRDLYDYLWDDDGSFPKSKTDSFQNRRTQVAEETVPSVVKPAEPVVRAETITIAETPKPKEQTTPVAETIAPVIRDIEAPVLKAPEVKIPEVVATAIAQPSAVTSSVSTIDPSILAELFAEEKVADLSDKLASQKIQDLNKAMGINEKIFTIQELFNNDNNLFNQAVGHLNTLPDFNTAKSYITSELVPRLDWASEKKVKKATTFIKLVRRRYM